MSQEAKDTYVILRVSPEEKLEYEKLAKETYGFKTASEFVRYALDYISTNRPILGKSFAPGNVNG